MAQSLATLRRMVVWRALMERTRLVDREIARYVHVVPPVSTSSLKETHLQMAVSVVNQGDLLDMDGQIAERVWQDINSRARLGRLMTLHAASVVLAPFP